MTKQIITKEHIAPGISKYGGVIDEHLKFVLQSNDLNFIPYKFNDGRIMLVYESEEFAILYSSLEELYEAIACDTC